MVTRALNAINGSIEMSAQFNALILLGADLEYASRTEIPIYTTGILGEVNGVGDHNGGNQHDGDKDGDKDGDGDGDGDGAPQQRQCNPFCVNVSSVSQQTLK